MTAMHIGSMKSHPSHSIDMNTQQQCAQGIRQLLHRMGEQSRNNREQLNFSRAAISSPFYVGDGAVKIAMAAIAEAL